MSPALLCVHHVCSWSLCCLVSRQTLTVKVWLPGWGYTGYPELPNGLPVAGASQAGSSNPAALDAPQLHLQPGPFRPDGSQPKLQPCTLGHQHPAPALQNRKQAVQPHALSYVHCSSASEAALQPKHPTSCSLHASWQAPMLHSQPCCRSLDQPARPAAAQQPLLKLANQPEACSASAPGCAPELVTPIAEQPPSLLARHDMARSHTLTLPVGAPSLPTPQELFPIATVACLLQLHLLLMPPSMLLLCPV